MVFLRRKQRDLAELQTDPHFPFYVGRLVGAAEMTSFWLQLGDQMPETQEMGRRLSTVVGWFLEDKPEPVNLYPPAEAADTQILPPKTQTPK